MPNILHRVGMRGTLDHVYQAIATREGLSKWWITGTKGEGTVGQHLHFKPEGGNFDMLVLELKPGALVHWRCVGGPPEWIGTEITFRLEYKNEQVFVLFKHSGWKEEVEFMHHCSTKWAVFLLSLKRYVETGEGQPLPYDVKIHVGD